MHPKCLDLIQDRNLIKAYFDGYKLSLTPTPVLRQNLPMAPFRTKPAEEQYSFLQMELFTMHNHLIQDPWHRSTSYFFASNGDIVEAYYDVNTGRPKPLQIVHSFGNLPQSKAGTYNTSFQFISERFCLFCDGDNEVILFDTGDRYKMIGWKILYRVQISKDFNGFLLRDARLDNIDGIKIISFCLQRVHNDGKVHLNQLFWCTIEEKLKNDWTYEIKDVLYGKGVLYYCAFEPKGQSLVLCSNKEFKFKNRGLEIPEQKINKELEEKSRFSSYTWSQTDEEIVIKFPKTENKSKGDYTVTSTKNNITAKFLDEVILQGILFSTVDPNLTSWTLENDFLQITLQKEAPHILWSFLIEHGPKESFEMGHKSFRVDEKPIANLEAQIEECDFPVYALEEEFSIDRINLETGGVTHRIVLGNNCPIFNTCLRPGFPPAIVTRQDVDASIWLQQYNATKPEEWNLRHEGNLHAFGYVQASKQQKKFVGCAPDLSYSVICESHRHVFIYKASYDTADGLRNRSGPQVSIGQQSLVTVEDAGEILGMATSDNFITLITEKCILYLQLRIT